MENISQPSPPPIGLKKRLVIPALFLSIVIILLLWGVIRGNWADAQPVKPASAADGVVTQLLQINEGRKQVRAVVIVAAPPGNVWQVITDYNHFSDVFPNISALKGTQDADGRWHLTGEVRSFVGHWPMDLHVRQEVSPTNYIASWDEPNGSWKVNRGSWTVSPHGSHETLLEYHLELSVSPFPDFVVRAVLLEQLKPALKAVANRALRDQSPR